MYIYSFIHIHIYTSACMRTYMNKRIHTGRQTDRHTHMGYGWTQHCGAEACWRVR